MPARAIVLLADMLAQKFVDCSSARLLRKRRRTKRSRVCASRMSVGVHSLEINICRQAGSQEGLWIIALVCVLALCGVPISNSAALRERLGPIDRQTRL